MRVTAEEMFTMRPPSRITGNARWMMNSGARTLTAKTRSNSSGVSCSRGVISRMPALLTKMSSGTPLSPTSRPANNLSRPPIVTELAADEKRLPAGLLDGGHGLLGGRVVAGVVHGDQGAVGAQPLGNGPADAPRGAGH